LGRELSFGPVDQDGAAEPEAVEGAGRQKHHDQQGDADTLDLGEPVEPVIGTFERSRERRELDVEIEPVDQGEGVRHGYPSAPGAVQEGPPEWKETRAWVRPGHEDAMRHGSANYTGHSPRASIRAMT
jgi:hypothetical protein